MNQVALSAQLVAGPQVAGDGVFPTGVATFTPQFSPTTKPYNTGTAGSQIVNSPSSYQAIGGLGAGGEVTQAHTVYFRSQSPFLVRETQVNPSGGTMQAVSWCGGVFIKEYPANAQLTLFEVQGSGQVEFGAWGNV